MGNLPCEKCLQGNYNADDTRHSIRQRSESSMLLEEVIILTSRTICHTIEINLIISIKYYYLFLYIFTRQIWSPLVEG